MKREDEITILTPVYLSDAEAPEIVDNILAQYENYGFNKFMISLPTGGWRSISYPPREYFQQKAELCREVKARLPQEISFGWWHSLTLKSGPTPGYTRIVRLNGTEAPFSTCPLDENFRKRFAEDAAFFCSIAHPDFVMTEDDFSMNCHGGPGCFCPKHLEEFARREGKYYSREELEHLFTERAVESRELLRRWQELAKDSLVLFARTLREETDKLTPEIPIGYMQSGASNKDGYCAEAVARAFAGPNHTPFVRFYGTFYCKERIQEIPAVLLPSTYAKEHIKGDFRFYHESDTYPHTRFYSSASCMRTLMGSAYSCGYEGSVFQNQQWLDNPDEEQGYSLMFRRERKRFNALRKSVENCTLQGAKICYDPFECGNFPGNYPEWLRPLAAFGIPYTTKEEGDIIFISGEQLRFLPEEKIMGLLSKNLFLDGNAARVLTERGFSKFTGAKVESGLLEGSTRFDLGAKEIIDEKLFPEFKGRKMTRADMYCPLGTGFLYKVEITEPGCQELTRICTFQQEYTAPGMTIFRNALGGNVVIYATALEKHFGSSLFNYRRQALLQELLIRCSADFPMVRNAPHVYLICNKPQEEKEFKALLTLTNLTADPVEELSLYLPENLRQCDGFSILDQEGEWQKIPVEKTADGVILKCLFNYACPVFLKIK